MLGAGNSEEFNFLVDRKIMVNFWWFVVVIGDDEVMTVMCDNDYMPPGFFVDGFHNG